MSEQTQNNGAMKIVIRIRKALVYGRDRSTINSEEHGIFGAAITDIGILVRKLKMGDVL